MLRNSFKDPSVYALIASNLFVAYLALTQHWSLLTLMLTYWVQSVIIGVFNFFRILELPQKKKAVKTAFFFIVHYMLFHMVYLFFIFFFLIFSNFAPLFASFAYIPKGSASFLFSLKRMRIDYFAVLVSSSIFFLNHLFSYLHNRARDNKALTASQLMMYPYFRIIPMHLVIIFFFFLSSLGISLLAFLALKTLADVAMHTYEHEVLRKK